MMLKRFAFNMTHIRQLERIPALVGLVGAADITAGLHELVADSGFEASKMGLELGEGHFDWVQAS